MAGVADQVRFWQACQGTTSQPQPIGPELGPEFWAYRRPAAPAAPAAGPLTRRARRTNRRSA